MNKLTASVVLFLFFSINASAQVVADLVIVNANVHTMDTAKPAARSLGVLNGRIIAVGNDADTRALIGPSTRVIDAGGKVVMPGFNDAHTHFLETGVQLSAVDLRSAKSPQEFVQRLKDFAAKLPKGRWIIGGKWDHENWTPADLPTAAMIDAATPNNPVFVDRLDGHMGVANSLAMKLAGIDARVKDVDGGIIVRDPNGNPTGVFKDAAMDLIQAKIPPMNAEERADALLAATEHAASLGVTSVTELGYSTDPMAIRGADIGVYQELARTGKMKTRVYLCSPL
jgi:predicted amidohydrolase YtcJ